VQHSLFQDASDFKFFDTYALSSNNIIFNPKTLEIKDSFVGEIESSSRDLNKIVSHRKNIIYLSKFNNTKRKYELLEIPINEQRFNESYLSPNGQFLVLQDKSNKYILYDIEKNETIKFFSGNFLAFSNEGNLIIEKDGTRNVKIYDPLTFSDITPPNYHHYRFLSPDGKLYAQVSKKIRYINKLSGQELKINEVTKFRQELDLPIIAFYTTPEQKIEYEKIKNQIYKNRRALFLDNKTKFDEIGIDDYSEISSNTIVKVERFIEIGIVGTNITTEIHFPLNLKYYNYASFSYDNKFFGYVGKPSSRGIIHLFKLDFDEHNKKLSVVDSYLSMFPKYASWVCGFSKTGYFATYDSTPDTYLIKVNERFFDLKTTEIELRNNIYNSKSNIYHQYNNWNIINGKNFLCFSPSGKYLSLSEQGYEPLTLGGYGHQESNAVHIAITETGEIIDSFTGHGDMIKKNSSKKVTFVAFSKNEKRIMTLSSDGVVVIRNINITKTINNITKTPTANIVYK